MGYFIIDPGTGNGGLLIWGGCKNSFTVAKCHSGAWYINGAVKKGKTWHIHPTTVQVGYLRALDQAGMPRQRMTEHWPMIPRFILDKALEFFVPGMSA